MLRPSYSLFGLALLVCTLAACGGSEPTGPNPSGADNPGAAGTMPVDQAEPRDIQEKLVPGKPAVTEPIELGREIERLLDSVTDRASAMDKRIAIDGRLLALRKKLPDWEHLHSAARELLKPHGEEGQILADRVRSKALALAENPAVKAILMPYLQQVQDLLK